MAAGDEGYRTRSLGQRAPGRYPGARPAACAGITQPHREAKPAPRGHRFDVRPQAVVARHLDNCAVRGCRRHAELVPLTLHDERRNRDLRRARVDGSVAPASSGAAVAGGTRGRARATAPVVSAVRHATRAPRDRPPTTSGKPRSSPSRRCSTTAVQAASSWRAGAGERRPGDAVGLLDERDAEPFRARSSVAATRSGAVTPPPAPCPITRAARGSSAACKWARAGPCGVSTSSVVTQVMVAAGDGFQKRGRGYNWPISDSS